MYHRPKCNSGFEGAGIHKEKRPKGAMSVFSNLYLLTSRNRFRKSFQPTRIRRGAKLLIHAGNSKIQIMKAIPLIHTLRRTGRIFMVLPSTCADLARIMKTNLDKVFYYEKSLKVLDPQHRQIARSIADEKLDFLFELGCPANISIPYLANFNQRICIGDRRSLPYYNIIFTDTGALLNYFGLKSTSTSMLFNLSKKKVMEIRNKYALNTPYVVVNGQRVIESEHRKFIIGKDIDTDNPDLYAVLMAAQGYFGANDHWAEFARLNNIATIGLDQ